MGSTGKGLASHCFLGLLLAAFPVPLGLWMHRTAGLSRSSAKPN